MAHGGEEQGLILPGTSISPGTPIQPGSPISPGITIRSETTIEQASIARDGWLRIRDAGPIQSHVTHRGLRSELGGAREGPGVGGGAVDWGEVSASLFGRPSWEPHSPQGETSALKGQGAPALKGPQRPSGAAPCVLIFSPLPGATTRWNPFPGESRCGIPALVRAPCAGCRPGRSTDCHSRAHGF